MPARGMVPAQQRFDADDTAAVGGNDGLKVQFQFAGAHRPRQFAADELLVARLRVDRALVSDNGAWALLRRLAQREFAAVGEFAARRCMARRLGKAGAAAMRTTVPIQCGRATASSAARSTATAS